MSIIAKLQAIQSELEVPKSQYNSFGKYYFRNAEDILAAAKPICIKHGCLLTITDGLAVEGDRFYIVATARLESEDGNISTNAFAREELTKKGMDAAQVTGAASSYARKYALNGLFCIDDTKDADHNGKESKPVTVEDAQKTFNSDFTQEDEEYINSQQAPADTGDKTDIVRADCEACNEPMTQGQMNLSKQKYGKMLCPACQKKEAV